MSVKKVFRSVLYSPVLFCGCLLAVAGPAQAALIASSAVSYDEGLFNGTVTINGPTVNGGGTSAVGYNSAVVPGIATSGFGMAEYGGLHASAFSGITNPGVGATSQTRGLGSAFWSDQITFSSTTLTGPAFARAAFSLSGGLDSIADVGATANSTIAARIQVNGSTVFSTTGQLVAQSGAITVNDVRRGAAVNGVFDNEIVSGLAGTFVFDIPFQFNVAFGMTGSLDAFTQALSGLGGATANANSNFGSSGLWGGISEVHLADGTVLSGFGLSSVSGFNWMNAFASTPGPIEPDPAAVPAPATLWLFGAGLLGLIGVRRRKSA